MQRSFYLTQNLPWCLQGCTFRMQKKGKLSDFLINILTAALFPGKLKKASGPYF
jgi:hypothetical protein